MSDLIFSRQTHSYYATRPGLSTLSCHYTYLAGHGTNQLHTSSPAVGWDKVPDCVYSAHEMLVDLQSYSVSKDGPDQPEFNQGVFVVGSGGNGVNSFKASAFFATQSLREFMSFVLLAGS
jgi:hypothetical protein